MRDSFVKSRCNVQIGIVHNSGDSQLRWEICQEFQARAVAGMFTPLFSCSSKWRYYLLTTLLCLGVSVGRRCVLSKPWLAPGSPGGAAQPAVCICQRTHTRIAHPCSLGENNIGADCCDHQYHRLISTSIYSACISFIMWSRLELKHVIYRMYPEAERWKAIGECFNTGSSKTYRNSWVSVNINYQFLGFL